MHGDVYGSQCVGRVAAPAAPDGRAVEIVRRLDWRCWDTIGAIILRCQMSRGGGSQKRKGRGTSLSLSMFMSEPVSMVTMDAKQSSRAGATGRATVQSRREAELPALGSFGQCLHRIGGRMSRQHVSIQKTAQLH